MYVRSTYQPPRVPSQQMGVIQASGNLIQIIQKQAATNRITIPEMYIGDEGALQLAAFLKGQTSISMIDLKGNNIGPNGFIEIFNSLRQNFQLKSLNLEWNRLGTDIAGLESLYVLLSNNRSITHLDLRNNKINQTGAHIIANIIRNNTSLSSLDLRWNELGANGGRAILQAMQENGCLVGLELAGNGIPEEINSEIQQLVTNNRDGIPHSAARRNNAMNDSRRNSFYRQQQPQQDFNESINDRETIRFVAQHHQPQYPYQVPIMQEAFNQSRTRIMDQNEISRNLQAGYESVNLIQHLEIQIDNERVQGLALKESLQGKISELKSALQVKAQKKAQLEEEFLARQHEQSTLKTDLHRVEAELKGYEHEKQKSKRELEDKCHLQEEKIRDTDKRLQSELLSISDQNIRQMRQVDSEYHEKCEELIKQVGIRSKKNDETRLEIYRIMDDMVKSEFQSKDEAKEVVEKLKAAGQQEYNDRFDILERRMNDHEQKIMDSDRRTTDLVKDYSNRIKSNTEKINEINQSVVKYKIENQDIDLNNTEFEMYIERQRADLDYKEQLIKKLKEELNKLKEKDNLTEQDEKTIKSQLEDKFIKAHDEHNTLHDSYRDRIQELEKTLRDSNEENLRLRANYQKLSDLLSANLQSTTYQTFKDQKVM
ncbi:hypothetical protein ABPG74_009886 [Tetrahymena malaccensis]